MLMRKLLVAASLVATLLAGQAIASDSDVSPGDRVGAPADASTDNFAGVGGESVLFILLSAGLIIGIAYGIGDGAPHPISP
jgi:hypothetical protein